MFPNLLPTLQRDVIGDEDSSKHVCCGNAEVCLAVRRHLFASRDWKGDVDEHALADLQMMTGEAVVRDDVVVGHHCLVKVVVENEADARLVLLRVGEDKAFLTVVKCFQAAQKNNNI